MGTRDRQNRSLQGRTLTDARNNWHAEVESHDLGHFVKVAVSGIGSDGIINPLRQTRGALDVYLQDQTTFIQDLYLHQNIGNIFLQNSSSINDLILDVTSHDVSSGNLICLKENARYYQGQVLTLNNSQIGMDTPLDYSFTTSAEVHNAEHDMAVDGSGTTQYFNVSPPKGIVWDIVRIMIYIEDPRTMNDGLFGGGDPLTKGVVLRAKDGTYKNIFNCKTNGEFAQRAYDRDYVTDKAPASQDSMIVRRTFGGQGKNGVVIRLDGDTLDELEMIIQDDCTSLGHFHVIAQGHVVE